MVFYIAFASISLFACFLQLFISFRKSGDLQFMVSALLSLIIFISFGIVVFCSTSLGRSCPQFTLLRCQLIIIQVVAIGMLGVLFHFLKDYKRRNIRYNIFILGLLILISLIVPDNILFGNDASTRHLILPHGDNILMIGTGFTLWRILIDITILVFAGSVFYSFVKRLDFISFRTIIILYSGLGTILMAGIYDQLVDLGQIYSTYMLPFASFIFYLILTFIPFVFFIKEIINQQQIIEQEEKWRNLLNKAEIIVVGLNRMGHVEFINPYFFELTGYQEDEVMGKDWFEFFVPPKDYYNLQGAFIEILEFEFHPHYFNPILTKKKEEIMIRWFNVRTRDHQDTITGSLSIGVDVTKDFLEKNDLIKKLKDAEDLIVELSQKGSRS